MGEARVKELVARAQALARSDLCIFCGGQSMALEGDHVPPRSMFVGRRWPEGYVFPACKACNAGSRETDRLVAFLSRLDPGFQWSGNGSEAEAESIALFKAVNSRHRALIRSMFEVPTLSKKKVANRIGMVRPGGGVYKDLPILRVPPELDSSVRAFAIKTAKALHFHNTGRIVPAAAGFRVKWYTNVSQLEGKIPEEVFTIPTAQPLLQRARVTLNDQFNYRFAVSDDGTLGMYTASFRFSFCFVVLLAFNASDIDDGNEPDQES